MDQYGIQIQVLSTIPVLFSYWAQPLDAYDISRFLNDHLADVVRRYPERFIGLGTLPMQDPSLAIQEMERCVHELGLAGIEIGSHINDWNLNDPALWNFMQQQKKWTHAYLYIPGIWWVRKKCLVTGYPGW